MLDFVEGIVEDLDENDIKLLSEFINERL